MNTPTHISPLPVEITESLLEEITDSIVDHFHPQQIILFGSQAYGTAIEDSDIDLLVIMETGLSPNKRSINIARKCRPRYVSMDILVRTPGEIADRLAQFDPFLEEILSHGRTLYRAAG